MANETPKPSPIESRVARLAELVEYQEGAVVSREVMKRPTGSVTVLAFADGQGLSEHTAPFDAMVALLDGEAEVTIAGRAMHLRPVEAVVMPANQPHALRAVTRFKMLLTMIRS